MSAPQSRSYRFGDASRPGVLLGLSARQAVPLVSGVLWLAACLQTSLSAPGGLIGLACAATIAFGRWRGAPLAEVIVPSVRLWMAKRLHRQHWARPVMADATYPLREPLPRVLAGIELIEVSRPDGITGWPAHVAVARDQAAGTLTASLQVSAEGFPLAAPLDQDMMLAGWGAAFAPFARERSPFTRIVWQEWGRPAGSGAHRDFLAATGALERVSERQTVDYLALVDQQGQVTMDREVFLALTIDLRRVRARGGRRSRFQTAVTQLLEELRLFAARLEAAGASVRGPLTLTQMATGIRERSDPGCTAQMASLRRSLAAAAGRVDPEWGPMVVEPTWRLVHVDGACHRTYRVATWPQLPVPADWLAPLLTEPHVTRTVAVVMEPVPLSQSARTADREAMAREADAESKGQRGFRITAKERKRLAEVEARERELAQGHAEFRYVGLVDICAASEDELDEAAAIVEQAAAQSMLDLRALEARHDLAWVACLPLGRSVTSRRGSSW